jgi:hypothetical protein
MRRRSVYAARRRSQHRSRFGGRSRAPTARQRSRRSGSSRAPAAHPPTTHTRLRPCGGRKATPSRAAVGQLALLLDQVARDVDRDLRLLPRRSRIHQLRMVMARAQLIQPQRRRQRRLAVPARQPQKRSLIHPPPRLAATIQRARKLPSSQRDTNDRFGRAIPPTIGQSTRKRPLRRPKNPEKLQSARLTESSVSYASE